MTKLFCFPKPMTQNWEVWASLVAQWLRIRLPMQGTRVWALVREDPTCHGATKPLRHNYWACALEPASHNYWACEPRAHALQQEKQLQWETCAQQWRPNTAKNKLKTKNKKQNWEVWSYTSPIWEVKFMLNKMRLFSFVSFFYWASFHPALETESLLSRRCWIFPPKKHVSIDMVSSRHACSYWHLSHKVYDKRSK